MLKFKKFIAIDCETSGLNFDRRSVDITDGYQSVSWGIVVSDMKTFLPIDELYVEIKWNGEDKWHHKAEEIHGLSKKYLEKHGMDEEEAAGTIALFLAEHFEPEESIVCLGHNPARFDIPFLKKLLHKFGYDFVFSHRAMDSFTAGVLMIGAYDSQQLFDKLGLNRGDVHNALEDAKCSLESCRLIRQMFRDALA